jgi:hypothetical protein
MMVDVGRWLCWWMFDGIQWVVAMGCGGGLSDLGDPWFYSSIIKSLLV